MSYVFISHSSRDKHIIEPICNYLKQNKINYWTDKEGVPIGLDYRGIIANAITSPKCEAVVLVLSYGSASSKEVDIEISLARDYNKRIIVYKIHRLDYDQRLGGIFYYIKYSQSIDASQDPIGKENLEVLVKSIEKEQKEGEDIEVLKLKDFEINESYYASDAKHYKEWGETILKYADKFNPQNTELYRQAKDKLIKANSIDGENYENYVNLAIVSLRLAKLENKFSLYEEGYEYYKKAINLNDDYKLLLGCIRLITDWALYDEKRRDDLINIAEFNFKKAQKIEKNNYNLYLDWAEFISNIGLRNATAEKGETFILCCNMYKTAFQLNRQMNEILHKWNKVLAYWGSILGLENKNINWQFDVILDTCKLSNINVRTYLFELSKFQTCYAQSSFVKNSRNEVDVLNLEEINLILNSAISKYEFLIECSGIDIKSLCCNYGIAVSLKAKINKDETAFRKALELFDKEINYDSLYNSAILLLDWAGITPDIEDRDKLYREVILRLEKAKEQNSENPDILNILGIACKNISKGKSVEEEQKWLRKALEYFKLASDINVQSIFKL